MRKVVLAGGCFWGVEEYYRRLHGVMDTRVGYAQGTIDRPSYEEVRTQTTHHREVVEISYDETQITLPMLLDHLFRMIDPTIINRQGNDIGESYQSGMYFDNELDHAIMEEFLAQQQLQYTVPLRVECAPCKQFWDAETYHQQYLVKHPNGYCHVDFTNIKEHEKKRNQ